MNPQTVVKELATQIFDLSLWKEAIELDARTKCIQTLSGFRYEGTVRSTYLEMLEARRACKAEIVEVE